MRGSSIFLFIFVMWILIIVGGGLAVLVLGPISLSGFGELDWILSSGLKAIVAITMVVVWIFILSKVKNWIFKKELKS